MKMAYPFHDGPLEGDELALPFEVSPPTRLDLRNAIGGIIGHYQSCSIAHPDTKVSDPEETIEYRPGYAWLPHLGLACPECFSQEEKESESRIHSCGNCNCTWIA